MEGLRHPTVVLQFWLLRDHDGRTLARYDKKLATPDGVDRKTAEDHRQRGGGNGEKAGKILAGEQGVEEGE